jgi:hypothetical protein
MRIFIAVAVLAISAFAASAACGGDDKTIDVGDGEVNVSDDLPDEFPDELVYDGADLQGSIQGETSGIEGIVATWSTDDDADDVKSFYEDLFDGEGDWTSDSKGDLGGSSFFTAKHSDGQRVAYVLVGSGDVTGEDKTSIVITVGDDPSLSSGDGDDSSGDGDEATPDDGGSGGDGGDADASLPEETDLPDDFPEDEVPLPDDIRVTGASSFSGSGVTTYLIEFYSQDSVDELKDAIKGDLEDAGWDETVTTTSNGAVFATYTRGDGSDGQAVIVNIGDADVEGYSVVSLSVALND